MVGAVLAFVINELSVGNVVLDVPAIGLTLMFVSLVASPISLLLWNQYEPGKRRRLRRTG